MKRLVAALAALVALAVPAIASAHPLGNFTINHSSTVTVSGDRVYVHYVLDMAEIPTLQARQAGEIHAAALRSRAVPGLLLAVDGRRAQLRPLRQRLQLRSGAGGLPTTRYELVLAGPQLKGASSLELRDETYPGRLGWKEVVVSAGAGASITATTAPSTSPSRQLRAYPTDGLSSPLAVTRARATVEPGPAPGAPPPLTEQTAEPHSSGFESLVTRDLGPAGILVALAFALFWGAAHALGPGHGKSIVAAYLIGQRGTVRHAVYLGGIVTVTHTAGVFALGAITLLLSELIVPEDLYPWLNLVAGVMVVVIGAGVLRARLAHRVAHRRAHAQGHHHHHHDHHDHDHRDLSPRSLLAVGVSGGLLPCPSALVVLLAAISLHRTAFGLALVLAFSVGLALTITAIGLVAVLARGIFRRTSFNGPLVRALPAASAVVIVFAGLVMTARALPTVS
jgi:ABC-type nickel/cobalt efflux system permease component RcnA